MSSEPTTQTTTQPEAPPPASEKKEIAVRQPKPGDDATEMSFYTGPGFNLLQRAADMLAKSTLVPKEYQGSMANCAIALNMANRLKADVLMVIQNLYIVYNRPGWSSQFLIATLNQCGRFHSLRYEWKGQPRDDDWGCRAWTIEKATGDRLDGVWVTWKMATDEGWVNKNGSKWKTMPDQMFMYRSASFFVRAYAPEIAMGLPTREELEDVIDLSPGEGGTYEFKEVEDESPKKPNGSTPTEDLTAQLKQKRESKAAPAPTPEKAPEEQEKQPEEKAATEEASDDEDGMTEEEKNRAYLKEMADACKEAGKTQTLKAKLEIAVGTGNIARISAEKLGPAIKVASDLLKA